MLIFEKAHLETKAGIKEHMKKEKQLHEDCLRAKRGLIDEKRTIEFNEQDRDKP